MRERFRMFSYRQIRRFSHAENKLAVLRYIEERLVVRGPPALEVPLAVYRLLACGISHLVNLGSSQ
jgi:hypothetical protein